MERAGIDIITDGEIRRESYSNPLATALSGVDLDNPATVRGPTSGTAMVRCITNSIRPFSVVRRNRKDQRGGISRTSK
jgi:5-methyltetrahydropteroyltriglutamate--homocysteine methyltransferase